jgi:hypothetical protein
MGWNKGYTIFEATVIGAYDLGKLDKDMLTVLMEPYRGTDIDSGGSCALKSKDGKGVEQIVIETWGLVMPAPPSNKFDTPESWDAWDTYNDAVYIQMQVVTKHFGWR